MDQAVRYIGKEEIKHTDTKADIDYYEFEGKKANNRAQYCAQ